MKERKSERSSTLLDGILPKHKYGVMCGCGARVNAGIESPGDGLQSVEKQ